jgi:hypothetical protein
VDPTEEVEAALRKHGVLAHDRVKCSYWFRKTAPSPVDIDAFRDAAVAAGFDHPGAHRQGDRVYFGARVIDKASARVFRLNSARARELARSQCFDYLGWMLEQPPFVPGGLRDGDDPDGA